MHSRLPPTAMRRRRAASTRDMRAECHPPRSRCAPENSPPRRNAGARPSRPRISQPRGTNRDAAWRWTDPSLASFANILPALHLRQRASDRPEAAPGECDGRPCSPPDRASWPGERRSNRDCGGSMTVASAAAIRSQRTSNAECRSPPAPAAKTNIDAMISMRATSARKPPLSASASTASDSSTRPSSCPAPWWRRLSGSNRRSRRRAAASAACPRRWRPSLASA